MRSIPERSSLWPTANPVEVQILYPNAGIDEPLAAVADRYELDLEALHAAVAQPFVARTPVTR